MVELNPWNKNSPSVKTKFHFSLLIGTLCLFAEACAVCVSKHTVQCYLIMLVLFSYSSPLFPCAFILIPLSNNSPNPILSPSAKSPRQIFHICICTISVQAWWSPSWMVVTNFRLFLDLLLSLILFLSSGLTRWITRGKLPSLCEIQFALLEISSIIQTPKYNLCRSQSDSSLFPKYLLCSPAAIFLPVWGNLAQGLKPSSYVPWASSLHWS